MLNPVVVDNSIRCLECSLRRDSLALSLFLAVSFAVRDKPIVDLLQSIAFPIKSRGCAHSYISAHVNRGTHSHARGFFFVSSLDRNEFIELFTITKYEWTAVRRWHAQAHNSVVATRCDFKKLYKLKSSWKSLGLRRRLHTVCVSVSVCAWVLGSDFSDCRIRYYRQSVRDNMHTHISTYGNFRSQSSNRKHFEHGWTSRAVQFMASRALGKCLFYYLSAVVAVVYAGV